MSDNSPFMKFQIFRKKLKIGYSFSFLYFGLKKILKPDIPCRPDSHEVYGI